MPVEVLLLLIHHPTPDTGLPPLLHCVPGTSSGKLTGAPAPRDAVRLPGLQDNDASDDARHAYHQTQDTDHSLLRLGHLDQLLGLWGTKERQS